MNEKLEEAFEEYWNAKTNLMKALRKISYRVRYADGKKQEKNKDRYLLQKDIVVRSLRKLDYIIMMAIKMRK